jgi:predicted RNA binding protein YcfA (HicA-like mRNA interferase family)
MRYCVASFFLFIMSKIAKLIKYLLSHPPEARFDDISYVLKSFGYQEVRARGSHHIFENDEGEVIVIPQKSGKKVKRTYIEEIIKLLDLENWQNDTK